MIHYFTHYNQKQDEITDSDHIMHNKYKWYCKYEWYEKKQWYIQKKAIYEIEECKDCAICKCDYTSFQYRELCTDQYYIIYKKNYFTIHKRDIIIRQIENWEEIAIQKYNITLNYSEIEIKLINVR